MSELNGKKILVTGASRGIGAGIAQELAKAGAKMALTYASRSDAAEAVLKSLHGDGHFILQMDVADESSVHNGVSKVLEKFQTIDGLVNNAGVTGDQLLLRMSSTEFSRVVDTNLKGVFLCTKALLKPMIKNKGGSIVNITSVIGQMGNAGQANYAASKAGIEGFTKSVAKEVGSRGIRANCVAPGFIVTEMTSELSSAQTEALLQNLPLKRLGEVKDIASAVRFLLSDEASYITGQTLAVNGGLYM